MTQDMFQLFSSVWPVVIMVVIFYFMLYRPQKKEQKRRQTMLDSLKKDTKVVTAGGIYGTVVSLDETTVMLRVSEKVEIKFSRNAISQVLDGK